MFSRKKTVTRHRTATIAMVTVLVVTLIAYFFSERVLRQAMLRPIKRENVDFAKVLDWLPPKAKAELEYRARYLDLRQKYDQAETKEEKLRTAYALAIHTRDQKEHNQLMLQFIDNPAYAGMKNLYQPYVRMLYDPKNPAAISIQKYYDFLRTVTDPEQQFFAWRDARDRLGKLGLRNLHIIHTDFLLPLLEKPRESFLIREYTQLFDTLKRNAARIANDGVKRLARKMEQPGDRELIARMRAIAKKAEEYQKFVGQNPRNYSLNDYRRLLKLREEYKNATPEKKLTAAFQLVRLSRDPKERLAVANEVRQDPANRKDPKIAPVFAQLADDPEFVRTVFHPYLSEQKDPVLIFRTWQEVYRRLTAVPISAAQKLDAFRPLLSYPMDQIHFREYDYIYDMVSRCAVFVNDRAAVEKADRMKEEIQKTKPPLKQYLERQKKQESR